VARQPVHLDLAVSYGLPRSGVPAPASFRRWVEAALHGRRQRAEIALRLVDLDEGRTLNREFRGRDYATNVLSFAAELPPGLPASASAMLGDLAICVPVVQREAAEQGKPAQAHFAHLTVHGVLHLLGLDHVTAEESEAMEAAERTILAGLGYPDPY
jgi:probable rRNA maturation factor